MKRRVMFWAALAALVVTGGAAAAAPVDALSPLALPIVQTPGGTPGITVGATGESGAPFAAALVLRPVRDPRFESVRYRPRRPRTYRDEGPRPESFSQVHAGFMDPEGQEESGVLFGFRGGLALDPNVQIGGQIDWRHRSNSATAVISEGPGPSGTIITTRADLARSSSDLVPLLGFVQFGASDLAVIPYVGLGAGYEVLHLSARDFLTGAEFNGTFGGFGWQAWGGAAYPLSGRTRINAEVFVNQAELSRDIEDPSSGQNFRETVNMDATGMRFGLQWGF